MEVFYEIWLAVMIKFNRHALLAIYILLNFPNFTGHLTLVLCLADKAFNLESSSSL